MLPSRSSVTRFSGSGRSSEVSQKSNEWFAMMSRVKPGGERWRAGLQSRPIQLTDERNMAHRILEFLGSKIVIVYRQRLLENRCIRAFRNRHQHGVDVAHI